MTVRREDTFTARCHTALFPKGLISPTAVLEFTTDDLAHALFTTGRAPGDQVSHGLASVWEFIHRVSLIPGYVRRSDGGGLVKSALAWELDRSEKVSLSYALGQAMTGIFCRKKLGVTFLLHVDRYASRYSVTFGATRKRADLIGRCTRGWVVAEAKGRSNGMEPALPSTLIAQKRSIKSIGGERPWLALGCVASFPPYAYELSINAVDPDDEEIDAVQLGIELDRYTLAYYEPFLAAVSVGVADEDQDQDYITSRLDLLNLRVGLRRDVAERVQRARQGEFQGLFQSVTELLQGDELEHGAVPSFPDGTLMETNWTDSIALNDWRF
ncbi:hypothetical protein V6U81_01640 [Micromonospora sp. CPCC 205711]|uniref:hypothetical protein n=1 Tax=Micromonospora sp. CPCC 205547 TaxID=3122400 RepID=UPI002FEF2B23